MAKAHDVFGLGAVEEWHLCESTSLFRGRRGGWAVQRCGLHLFCLSDVCVAAISMNAK